MRTAKALVRDGKFTLGDLAKLTRWHLTVIPNLGPKGRQAIRDVLAAHGYDITRLAEPPVPRNRERLLVHRRRALAALSDLTLPQEIRDLYELVADKAEAALGRLTVTR